MSIRRRNQRRKEFKMEKGYTIDETIYSSSEEIPEQVSLNRRKKSLSLTSLSSGSDNELSPVLLRRGRRPAIVDTKNVGDVSVTQSDELTPSNSCDEAETDRLGRGMMRRRSSVDLETKTYQRDQVLRDRRKRLIKRNTISDFYANRTNSTTPFCDDGKRGNRQSFSFRKLMKAKSKETLTRLGDVLGKLKKSEFQDNYLASYKKIHWSELIAEKENTFNCLSDTERKRREAIWELFSSECVFLIDHLMVLKHCFFEPLKKVQVEGHIMYAEPQEIFGNLDELCYVSYTFSKDLLTILTRNLTSQSVWNTDILVEALEGFSRLSEDGGVYHTYCLNYIKSLEYLEKLRRNDDFCEFEKWCEMDGRCNRLQLNDLLVSPMQHCTKLPLLISNIRKYTIGEDDKVQLTKAIGKVEVSLQSLEEKMKLEKDQHRILEIQQQLVWPSIADLDPKAYIPECLKPSLSVQPSTTLLACPKRQLVHEGQLTLTGKITPDAFRYICHKILIIGFYTQGKPYDLLKESTKTSDAHLFLFDDILLITKLKKMYKKKVYTNENNVTKTCSQTEIFYVVHRQPIALDRLSIHNVGSAEAAANGLRSCFVVVHISRFQQVIAVYTLQSPSDSIKECWLSTLKAAKQKYTLSQTKPETPNNGDARMVPTLNDFNHNDTLDKPTERPKELTPRKEVKMFDISPQRERRTRLLKFHKKSTSLDTVFVNDLL